MDILKELSASLEDVAQHSGRAAVQIFVRSYVTAGESEDSNGELLTAQNSSGSGIILSPMDHSHERARGERRAFGEGAIEHEDGGGGAQEWRPHSESAIPGTLVGVDRDTDLAVCED